MDTNELTSKAYEVLELSEEVHHLITVHIGALCSRLSDENDLNKEYCYLQLEGTIEMLKDCNVKKEGVCLSSFAM